MSSHVCAIGHIKDPVPLFKKSTALCPDGGFLLSFVHQVIVITGLTLYVVTLKMALDAERV